MPEPAPGPIYDDTVPIACTITDTEISDRIALIERIRAAMTTIERTPTGVLLHFPDHPEVRAGLGAFAVDEKRCCQFWGFDIIEEPTGLAFRWDGPPATDGLIAPLMTLFTTDAPISILDGLL